MVGVVPGLPIDSLSGFSKRASVGQGWCCVFVPDGHRLLGGWFVDG